MGVNYFEAEAYAVWANKRFPTEKGWERAARGAEGLNYPWGEAKARPSLTWFFWTLLHHLGVNQKKFGFYP